MITTTQTYQLRVDGHLDAHWASWLHTDQLTHDTEGTTSFLTRPLDQAQLHGVLAQVRDLGALLLHVGAVEPASEPEPALTKPLHTERLVLRPATADDADATWEYRRLPEVAEWLTELPNDQEAYRRNFADPERLAATVIVERDGDLIGDFMLRVEDAWAQAEVRDRAERSQAELGWTLNPAHTGRGYATEAAATLIDYCFTDLNLRRITANCFAGNAASIRLLGRLGMRCEARAVKESLHRSGRWMDTLQFARLSVDGGLEREG